MMERLGTSGIVMCCLFWLGCSVMTYGLFTKRSNDFCLMWSRNSVTGQVGTDWCDRWRSGDEQATMFVAVVGGPLALPAALMFASEESRPRMEFEHVAHAYPGKHAER